MFAVRKRIYRSPQDQRLRAFSLLSDGLVDLVVCIVANKRERKVRIASLFEGTALTLR